MGSSSATNTWGKMEPYHLQREKMGIFGIEETTAERRDDRVEEMMVRLGGAAFGGEVGGEFEEGQGCGCAECGLLEFVSDHCIYYVLFGYRQSLPAYLTLCISKKTEPFTIDISEAVENNSHAVMFWQEG